MVHIPRPPYPERRIIFGDGLQAQLLHVQEGDKDKDNNDVTTFWFKPLEHLKWVYQIQDEDYTNRQEWWIKRSYPKDKCKAINKSPFTTTFLVFVTYAGKEGLSIEEINKENERRAAEFQTELEFLEKAHAKLQYDFKELLLQPDVFNDKKTMDIKKLFEATGVTTKVPDVTNQSLGNPTDND